MHSLVPAQWARYVYSSEVVFILQVRVGTFQLYLATKMKAILTRYPLPPIHSAQTMCARCGRTVARVRWFTRPHDALGSPPPARGRLGGDYQAASRGGRLRTLPSRAQRNRALHWQRYRPPGTWQPCWKAQHTKHNPHTNTREYLSHIHYHTYSSLIQLISHSFVA